jgi:hypothetical protein
VDFLKKTSGAYTRRLPRLEACYQFILFPISGESSMFVAHNLVQQASSSGSCNRFDPVSGFVAELALQYDVNIGQE